RPEHRSALFKELRRCVCPDGVIVLVEHLRDLSNLLAFGPGFLHFHSRRSWVRLISEAGLTIGHELSITPLVQAFALGVTEATGFDDSARRTLTSAHRPGTRPVANDGGKHVTATAS